MTQVSLTTSTNYNGPLNAVVEDEGTTLVIRFDLDEPAPAGGLKVYIDSELNQSLNRLNLFGISAENINLGTLSSGLNGDNSGIAVDIDAGATFATITLPVFDDPEPARSLPETFEGLREVTYTLKTRDQVSAGDLPIIERNGTQVSDYTIDSSTSSSLVYFADTASQLPSTPTVSISASPTDLLEEDGTVMTLTINLSEPPPEGGINVTIDSDVPRSLAQFDVGGATYDGAQLAGANSDASGFTVKVTEQTATIQLAPFDDDVNEGPQNITYTLQATDDYMIDSAASSVSINIEDDDAPVVSFSATPTTISEADGTALVMNFSVTGDIPEEGITVKLEGDAARIMQQFTAAQTRFNDAGETFNRFDKGLVNEKVIGGTLELFSLEDGDPSESASNPDAAGDAYLTNFTFTITEPNASITIPVFDDLIEEENATYTYTLVEGDGYKVNDTANSTTFTVTDGVIGGGGPTVGVSAAPTTLFESQQTALTLTFTTEGEIPSEGVVVVLEGPPRAIAEFDVNATNPRLPESDTEVTGSVVNGGNIVGTNETAGAIVFRITEPTATITVPVFQDEEEEGLENLTFNLKDGELYNVDSSASAVSVTIEDVQTPTVSFSATPTTISEADGTALVMNFSVEGDIPEEGVTVKLEGDAARIMQQFTAAQTRFNDSGETFNRFDKGLVNNNVVGGTLELFSLEDGDSSESASNPDAAGDAYLTNFTFTITEPTASITIPVFDDIIEEADATYTYNLVEGDGYMVDDTANSATFTVTDGVVGGGGPTVGVSAAPTTLFESEQTALTLTFTTERDIPSEGVVVVLEGPPRAIAEFDVNATNPRLPESETEVTGPVVNGGNIVGTDETAGSIIFRITDPTATITVPVFQDEVEEGAENLTFNLRDGELYNVDSNANGVSLTINDVAEPVVSFSVNTTTLSEEEATLFTFNFSVNGVIPEGGLEVALGGELLPFIDQLDFSNFDFSNPDNVKGVTVGDFREDGAISLTLLEPSASLSVRVFDDVVKEADANFDLMLLEADGYSVNQEAKGATVTVTDGVIVDNPPTVALSVSDSNLTEGEEFTVNFSVDGDVSEDNPLTVLVNSTEVGALGEFNIFNEDGTPAYTTTGIQGTPRAGDDTGSSFLVELTDTEASITLPVFNDGIGEGTETVNFALVEGERYNVDGSINTIALTIEETPVEVKFEANENGEVSKFAYDLTGAGAMEVLATVSQDALDITDAAFDNLVGFYEVVDENGGIDTNGDGVADFNPGDDGYAKAALENALDGFALRVGGDTSDNTRASEFDAVVEGGKFYAPFAIANAGDMTVADFLAANPNNDAASSIDDQVAYFAFGEANPDGANHLKSWGDGIFGFEDLPDNLGVSDSDFNDAVFKFNFTA
jgi:hypothetical protein